MDDKNDDKYNLPPAGRADLVKMYVESLRARMEPEHFDLLLQALHGFNEAMENGGEGSFDLDTDAEALPEEVTRELADVVTMVGTGSMDHRIVEMPGPNGEKGWAVVSAEVADDPDGLRQLQEKLHRTLKERLPPKEPGPTDTAG
ncbi:hypothetical protein [Actinacidiphila acididurans]|uniref:Uncharacterized protein n=1 Tax=Actinacidiphila acididurans TaxID=2784346 RepID=A0ABS2U2X3_9ACTN|nr:hypothetical protein [Actinacidiphila acididurans]MBM9509942.1 hypothetical protein [Actinacidiphila acididurans]